MGWEVPLPNTSGELPSDRAADLTLRTARPKMVRLCPSLDVFEDDGGR